MWCPGEMVHRPAGGGCLCAVYSCKWEAGSSGAGRLDKYGRFAGGMEGSQDLKCLGGAWVSRLNV